MHSKSDSLQDKKRPSQLKFAPVKLIVLENRGQYMRTLLFGLGIGLSHVMIGAVVMAIIIFCTYDTRVGVHALFCTIGCHFFAAEGILCLTQANGWSAPLKLRHRRAGHIFFQVIGISLILCGTVISLAYRGVTSTPHSISGFVVHSFTALCLICAPLTMFELNFTTNAHKIMGVITLLTSSISLCLGFYTVPFKTWAHESVLYILLSCVIFSTVCITAHTIMRIVLKLHRFGK